jgi:hypothetical protein
MKIKKRTVLAAFAGLGIACLATGAAAQDKPLRIGLIAT